MTLQMFTSDYLKRMNTGNKSITNRFYCFVLWIAQHLKKNVKL